MAKEREKLSGRSFQVLEASFLVLLQGLPMGPDFPGRTHLCGLCSQLDTGMSSV